MQDGIIAGNGNSRYLKTVSAALGLYPTYEDFMAALIAGTFPIDLNGINAAGWTQQGTALNKANLLTDATCSALGIATTSTPNNALLKIKNLIDSANQNANNRTLLEIKSYIGTGASGENNPCSISFSFPPDVVIHMGNRSVNSGSFYYPSSIYNPYVLCSMLNTSFSVSEYLVFGCYGKISSDRKTISWYNYYSEDETQLNSKNYNYYFMALKSKV